ncbi:hypothetical protein HII12_004249 [Brettanomyces bruxellensis]|uniref:Uncharacterized protein n=1 Tax=Dekkera bruxellensis TaxID=5007 RepID=A0A8H6ERY9_DEKBR|nr:hypothetical protein HII12_004249 [Brettanomyces bruxellensis]
MPTSSSPNGEIDDYVHLMSKVNSDQFPPASSAAPLSSTHYAKPIASSDSTSSEKRRGKRAASPLRRGVFPYDSQSVLNSPLDSSSESLPSDSSTTQLPTSSINCAIKKDAGPLKSALARHGEHSSGNNFRRLVSFDTVNLGFSDDGSDSTSISSNNAGGNNLLDSEFGFHTDSHKRTNWRSPSPLDRDTSPLGRELSPRSRVDRAGNTLSPQSRSQSNGRSLSRTRSSIDSTFRKYPTIPIITHDAVTLTKKHKLFDKLYSGQLKPRLPIMPNRNILCYVSGRRHTWVAIDWCCNQFLEDGDTLVIIASIRPNWKRSLRRRLSSSSIFSTSHDLITDLNIKQSPEYTKIVTENLMKYVMAVLNPNKIIKITIELGVGNTKDVLKDMYSLYMPSIVVTSAKPTAAPSTKSWLTSRISDRLVKNFPVPVVIVPAQNMDLFQTKLFEALDKRMILWAAGKKDTDELLTNLGSAGIYTLGDQLTHLKKVAADDNLARNDMEEFLEGEDATDDSYDSESCVHSSDLPESFAYSENSQSRSSRSVSKSSYPDETKRKIAKSDSSHLNSDEISEESAPEIEAFRPSTNNDSSPQLKAKRPSLLRSKTESVVDNDKNSENAKHYDSRSLMSDKDGASFRLKQLEFDTQFHIYKEKDRLEEQPITEETYKHFLGVVSDMTYKYGVKLAESAKKGGEEASLIRTITGAPDVSYLRPKSMLLGANTERKSSGRNYLSPATPNGKRATSTPQIRVDSPAHIREGKSPIVSKFSDASSKPKSSSLKFDLRNPGPGVKSIKSVSPQASLHSYYSASSNPGTDGRKKRHRSFFKRLFGKS